MSVATMHRFSLIALICLFYILKGRRTLVDEYYTAAASVYI